MENNKLLSMFGMARRAGKLSMGHDMAKESLLKHKAKLLIVTSDASARIYDEFVRIGDRANKNTPMCKIDYTMEQIQMATGYKAGVFTVDDVNFAKRLEELINQEECTW